MRRLCHDRRSEDHRVGLADTGASSGPSTGVCRTRVRVEQREVPVSKVDVCSRRASPRCCIEGVLDGDSVPLSSRRLPLTPITCGVSGIVCLFVAAAYQ